MSDKAAAWSYCDEIVTEDAVLLAARERAGEIGAPTVHPSVGVFLAALAASMQAQNVVLAGANAGVVGLYLLRAMDSAGTLTCLDADAEQLQAAREAFAQDKIRTSRTRLIHGAGETIMNRLSTGAYDLVVLAENPSAIATQAQTALSLLHEHGTLVVLDALQEDRVADPARREDETVAMRNLIKELAEDPRLTVSLLPIGNGVLWAAKRA